MDEIEEFNSYVIDCSKGRRKRRKNPDEWDKNKKRVARNSASAHGEPTVECTHGEKGPCKASDLTPEDVSDFYNKIYKHKTAADQNCFIVKYMQVHEPKQHRPRKGNAQSRKVVKYFIRKKNGVILNICQKTFLSISRFSQKRVHTLMKYVQTGDSPTEKRGGARIKPKDKETTSSIIDFIGSLTCTESHYGRKKSIRSYLPSELSVRKLWRMWKETRKDKPVSSYSKFFHLFTTKFNLGFGNPKSDVCSFCDEKKVMIRASKDPREKCQLMAEYRLHKLRAKKFYELLKREEENVVKCSFDMQQNQPLPKLRVGEVFYARQIWVYNLTFVLMEKIQDKSNTFVYTWTENQSPRGSNEITSALHHFLANLEKKYENSAERSLTLKLFSDACSGQNKNTNVMMYLMNFVRNSRVFKRVEHIFPIRGHSFMPPDRVFGRYEKVLRKIETISEPEEYHKIYSTAATVNVLGADWQIYDYMSASKQVIVKKLPFKMRDQRVFVYSPKSYGKVACKNTYTGSENLFKVRFFISLFHFLIFLSILLNLFYNPLSPLCLLPYLFYLPTSPPYLSLTYLPTYLLTYLLTCLLTYLLTNFSTLLTYLPTYLLTYILTQPPTYLLTYLLTYPPTYLLTYLLIYLPTYLPTSQPYLPTYLPTSQPYLRIYLP
jgi:hypothetical protein